MMLELTKIDGSKVFLEPQFMASIEDLDVNFGTEKKPKIQTCTLIITSSGREHIVTEYSTDVYIERKHMMEQIADDNKLTLTIPGM